MRFFIFYYILISLLFSTSVVAQDDNLDDLSEAEYQKRRVEYLSQFIDKTTEATLVDKYEVANQTKVDELFVKVQKGDFKALEDIKILNIKEQQLLLEKLKASSNIDLSSLMSKKTEVDMNPTKVFNLDSLKDMNLAGYEQIIKDALKQFQTIDDDVFKNAILKNTKGTFFEKFIGPESSLLEFYIRLLKDPNAIPHLLKIFGQTSKMIIYASFFVATFILGIILKRKAVVYSFFGMVFHFILRSSFLMIVRLTIFFFLFYNELNPAVTLFRKTIFKI